MAVWVLLLTVALAQQQPPTPQPFPRPSTQPSRPVAPPPPTPPAPSPPSAPPTAPQVTAPSSTRPAGPTEAELGVPIYPGAQFLTSFDAGQGQRFYIFGSTAAFVDLVTYYRTILKSRGDVLFETPATHQFEIGRFREQTMAFPPGVTIKDYQSEISRGYPNPVAGAQPAHFPTVIQIVPAPAGAER